MSVNLCCKQCGSSMSQTTQSKSNILLQVLAVPIFLLGVFLLFLVPIGTLFGLLIIYGSAKLGYKKTKICKCNHCGYFFETA